MTTRKQAISSAMRVWHVNIDNVAAEYVSVFDDAIECVNGAMQEMWSTGDDFFSRSPYTVNLTASNNSYDLPDNIQEICDNCYFASDGVAIPRINTEGEFRNFAQQILGQVSNSFAESRPQAYFIKQNYQSGDDPAKTVILFTPTPAVPENVVIDTIIEPPTIRMSDYCDDPDAALPVPHKYGESVLIPFIMKRATSHFYASVMPGAELMFKQIDANYQVARQILTNIRTQKERNFNTGPNAYNTPSSEQPRRR